MDYAAIAATVVTLIAQTGRLVKLQQLSKTPADATKPWAGPGVPTIAAGEQTVAATFVPASGSGLGLSFIREDLLARADEVALIGPGAVDLSTFTIMLDNAVSWNVEWVQVLKPADVVLLYAFGVKR